MEGDTGRRDLRRDWSRDLTDGSPTTPIERNTALRRPHQGPTHPKDKNGGGPGNLENDQELQRPWFVLTAAG